MSDRKTILSAEKSRNWHPGHSPIRVVEGFTARRASPNLHRSDRLDSPRIQFAVSLDSGSCIPVAFLIRRILQSIAVLWFVVTVTFFLVRIAPGGPFSGEKAMSPEVEAALEARYGLDAPLPTQYLRYVGSLLRGDLGPSLSYPGWDVSEILVAKLPVSFELGAWALLFTVVAGVSLGVLAAAVRGTPCDDFVAGISLVGICLPTFVIGPVLMLVFGLGLNMFDIFGWDSPGDRVLPSITLGVVYMAFVARLTRGRLVDLANEPYIRTARAKGAPEWRVFWIHGVRNALAPVVSYLGPAAAGLVSGSFVVESVFGIPGLGRFFVNSAFNRDHMMVSGCVMIYALLLIVLNLLSDLLIAWLDPRSRTRSVNT